MRNSLATLWQDIRYALRTMRRTPGFTAVALLSLALGIGANTAIFSLIDTLMLRRLPVREPGQLVELLQKYPGEPRGGYWSWPSYEHYRDHNHVFSSLTGTSTDTRVSVRGEGLEPETVTGEYVAPNFFPVLGLKPAIGRLIGPDDDPGGAAAAVAVVSWSVWKNRFNLDPAIVGKRLIVQDAPVTVVGVAPRAYTGLQVGSRTDVWLPRPASARTSMNLLGRLKPGVSLEQARAEMTVLYRFTIEERAGATKDSLVRQMKVEVEPAGAGLSHWRDRFGKPLVVLMAVVGLLLLIACANIASMLLARGAARQREMAVRVSLGAGRFRLVRQVLTESLLLSAAGSLLGIAVAYWTTGSLLRIMASGRDLERFDVAVQPDAHMLLFTAGIALLTGVLFGLAPALYAFGSAPSSSLRQTGRAGETRFRKLFGKSLVAAQVALSVVLLSAAGLFVLNLSNLENLDMGFRRDHVLLVTLDPSRSGYRREQLSRPYQELLGRLEAIPGVRSATLGNTPISGAGASSFAIAEGFQEKPEDRRYVSIDWIAPKYFETLGMPLLAGRDFSFQDQGGPRIAIINQAMARYYFGSRDPIGKHIALERDWKGFGADQPYEIVGVAGDAKYYEIREAPPRTIYFNAFREGTVSSQFVLRTSVDPAAVGPEVRRTARDLLKTVPVTRVTTLADQVDASIVPERLIATLSGLFGALGSLLAAIGLYGLLAYTVARRVNEIGVRMALGATEGDVTRMVLGDALAMVTAGLAIGVPLALWGRKFAASLIEDLPVKSAIPIVFGAVAMIAVALVAAYVPARRAARVDPMEALRYE
ncbi:MAG TPA: ABC transporter permease [Bryobacteraceae bacterium]|nr:ABC transporter permease [Bryobacteraceae bacterium]